MNNQSKSIKKNRQLKQISKWFIRTRVFLFLLILSLVLLCLGIVRFEVQNKLLHDDFESEIQSIKLNNEYVQLSLYLKQAESDNRGYAFTGNKRFDENFDAYMDSIRTKYLLIQLLEKRKESKVDTSFFLKSDSLMQEKISWMDRVNTLCEDGERKAALALIATNKGIGLSDSILKINSKINKILEAELKKSQVSFLLLNTENDQLVYFVLLLLYC